MSAARRQPLLAWALGAVVLAVIIGALARGGREGHSEFAMENAGAQAAAEAYVAAIAAGDVATAEAMTDPQVLDPGDGDGPVDVSAALPNAQTRISSPWVRLLGTNGLGTFSFAVSYQLGELTGGAEVALELTGTDPGQVDSWTVSTPLLADSSVYADSRLVPVAQLGGVDVPLTEADYRHVEGYPGIYGVPAPDLGPYLIAEPVSVVIGPDHPDRLANPDLMLQPELSPALLAAIGADVESMLESCVASGGVDTPECRALPAPWSLAPWADDVDVIDGEWDPFVAPTVTVRDGHVQVAGDPIRFMIHSGTDSESGAPVTDRQVYLYLRARGAVTISGNNYTVEWE